MKIKNILFDMGGVVFEQDTTAGIHRFAETGLETDKFLGAFGQKGFFLDLEEGKISKEEFCKNMGKAIGREYTLEEAQDCWQQWIKAVPLDRLHHLLELKENYTLGLLSNTNPFVIDLVDSPAFSTDGLPISHYFNHLFLSFRLNVCKPSAKIFQKVLEEGGFNANETIFVDDSMSNIEAAEKFGIVGLYVPTNEDWWPKLNFLLEKLNS